MRFVSFIFSVFLLSACGSELPAPNTVVGKAEPVWDTSDSGSVTHLLSGVIFPATAGNYTQVRKMKFGDNIRDVGVVYQNLANANSGRSAEVTLYVTHSDLINYDDLTAEIYLDDASTAIQNRWKSAKFYMGGDFSIASIPRIEGPYHLFEVELEEGGFLSGAWTSVRGPWLLKARFTYPDKRTVEEKLIVELSKALNKKSSGLTVTIEGKDGTQTMDHIVELLTAVNWGN